MPAGELIKFDLFFDYQCPFVYRIAGLIDAVKSTGERNLDVRWRFFSLAQVNSKDDGWTVWDAPPSEPVRGRLAFQASAAARRQGRFDQLHEQLLEARHRDRLDLDDPLVVEGVAAGAGLDLERFRFDVADPTILEALAADHREGVSEHGVFGTPTLVFGTGPAAYVRLAPSALEDGGLDVFDRLMTVAAGEPRILEIKRPHKP